VSFSDRRYLAILLLQLGLVPWPGFAADDKLDEPTVAARRMDVMKSRIDQIRVSSSEAGIPERMRSVPLFRYDDETRGYVDGTVWRLGETGRPLALVTAELHPRYLNGGPVVVYDLLSLTSQRFTLRSPDLPGWSPGGSAISMEPLLGAPLPVTNRAGRLAQMKEQARRFTGTQDVSELDQQFVHLRLLPREIDRYSPTEAPLSDGALFLLVNGRNPALVLVIETDGNAWQWGVGRLSLPSDLELRLDGTTVWKQPRNPSYGWNSPYCATNRPAEFP
jgi:hypothetical protein